MPRCGDGKWTFGGEELELTEEEVAVRRFGTLTRLYEILCNAEI